MESATFIVCTTMQLLLLYIYYARQEAPPRPTYPTHIPLFLCARHDDFMRKMVEKKYGAHSREAETVLADLSAVQQLRSGAVQQDGGPGGEAARGGPRGPRAGLQSGRGTARGRRGSVGSVGSFIPGLLVGMGPGAQGSKGGDGGSETGALHTGTGLGGAAAGGGKDVSRCEAMHGSDGDCCGHGTM